MKTKLFQSTALVLALAFTGVNAFTNASNLKLFKSPEERTNSIRKVDVIENLEYDFAKASIRDNYYSELDKLAKTAVDGDYVLSLRGHADSIGSYVGNWKLSDKRALEVKEYLMEKGVKKERIVTTPYGSTLPIAPNTTPEGRQKNRRVEIKLRETNS